MNLLQENPIIKSTLNLEREMKTQTLVQKNQVTYEKCSINPIDIIHKRCNPLLQRRRSHKFENQEPREPRE